MVKQNRTDRTDPAWPDHGGTAPVTELTGPVQGALSPYGDVEFPLPADQLPYVHPVTEINR